MSELHKVELFPSNAEITVTLGGEVIARTSRPLRIQETGHSDVYYLPREDVRMDLLQRTEHASRCPYKGAANYFTITAGGKTAENAVWTYESPIAGAEGLKGYLAFYPDRVDTLEVSGR